MSRFVVFAVVGLLPMTMPCTSAHAAGGLSSCKVGDRVQDSDGGKGTVTYVNTDGSCGFRYDRSGLVNTYPPNALRAIGPANVQKSLPVALMLGRYECYAGENYSFTDIIVRSSSAYSDNKGHNGAYSFDRATQAITFKSGTFKG